MHTSTDGKAQGHLAAIAACAVRELRLIAGSYSILLVMMGGIFLYGLLYNYMYAPNLVRSVPLVVVDQSDTPLSRTYARLLDASPQVSVYGHTPDMPGARRLMKTDRVAGIVFLPEDFERRVGRGEQSVFLAFGSTSAFLDYAALEEAAAGAMQQLDERVRPEMAVFLPPAALYALAQVRAPEVVGTALYNPTEGYGSYLIPAVLVIILFQTLMMVIGMISGRERYDNSILFHARNGLDFARMADAVAGKSFIYCMLYALFALFLTGLLPHLFSIPHIGNAWDTVLLMIPYLLATCFFGLTGSLFFTDSESPILMIAFFSVGLIFLSGMSYPLELMPWYWRALHYAIPAPPAVLAYIQLNSMGATLSDVRTEYLTLWIQCAVYFVTACLAYRYNILRSLRRAAPARPAATHGDRSGE